MTNKLNTTKIGDEFESKSLAIIKKVIEEAQLGHLAPCLQIFSKKEYYSPQRKKNIKFDLTIEVWPPGAARYVLIYIIECKDFATRVPVNKVEDFINKLQQVSGVNVKGIFISNSPLQEAAYNIAESVGMMFIQGESSDDYKIILHKSNRSSQTNKLPLIKETISRELIDTGVELIENLIDKKIIDIFKTNVDASRVSYNIDRLSKAEIEKITKEELQKIDPKISSAVHTLSPKKLIEYLGNRYGISFVDINSTSGLLGSCDIKNNIIGINSTIKGTSRELFIIGHEFGHYLLHQKLSIGQAMYDAFEDSEYNFRTGKNDLKNSRHWIEWQANHFASSLVLPSVPFLARLYSCQDSLNKSHGKIYLDDQYNNVKDFSELIKKMSYLFNVTKTSIIYKLKEMELLNDQSRLKSIGQVISEYNDELVM
ncbi:MAG: ImmA/IrrE family metallo-endopeptidase [Bacteroidota bacterium]